MKDIAKYINGRAFKPTEWQAHGKPIIRIQNLTGSTKTLNRYSGGVDDKYLIYDGDVLISWSATLGVYVYRGEPAILNQHIFKVRPYIDKFFIFYLVLNVLNDLKKKVHGTGMQHIKQKPFENHLVSIPPLNEQKRIVSKIESIFAQIDACKQRLMELQGKIQTGSISLAALKSSVLKQAFEGSLTKDWRTFNKEIPAIHLIQKIISHRTKLILVSTDNKTKKQLQKNSEVSVIGVNKQIPTWVDVRLENLVYIAGRIGWRGLKADEYTTKGPLFLSTHQINNGKNVNLKNTYHISQARYDESPEIKLCNNDILLVKDGSGIGKISIVSSLNCPATVNSSLLIIRSLEAFIPKFLFYFLYGPKLQTVVHQRIAGSAIPHLFQKDIKKFILSVPPINEQKQIVSKIESIFARIDAMDTHIKLTLQLLDMLKSSTLKQAFEGKLVPQDPKDESADKLLEQIQHRRQLNVQ